MTFEDNINDPLYLAAGFKTKKYNNLEIKSLAEMERAYIEMVIMLCDGNVTKAAEVLQVSASTIYRKKLIWEQDAH